jgi:hypothetical protein
MFSFACPAPPLEGGEPSIQLLYPQHSTTTLALDAQCHLKSLVVVDIEGLEFVPPGSTDQNVDGQGHWHVYVDPLASYGMPMDPAVYDMDMFQPDKPDDLKADVGTEMRLWVQLQNNLHIPIDCDLCVDALEFELEDPLDCVPPPVTGG